MADEKLPAPTPSRAPSIEAGAPQASSRMLANTENGKLPPYGESKETPISSSSSSTIQNRPRNRGIPTSLHLAGLLHVKIGAGIVRDIRARAPWYWSDWKDAWNYRVLPATALVFFAK
jgi:boron transporter